MQRLVWLLVPAALLFSGAALALQESHSASPTREFTQPELERLLAPVALYPDTLLSQVLMASTYPDELAEAARWSILHPGLAGDAAVRAALREPWDTSVKLLVAFPLLAVRMSESMDWTRRLGQAFLAREPEVLDAIQRLRRKAQAAGHLRSGEHMQVQTQGTNLVIDSASHTHLFVPHYGAAVYATAWPVAHPPIEWAPWPGYSRRPGSALAWAPGVSLSRGAVFGGFNWSARHTHVASLRSFASSPLPEPRRAPAPSSPPDTARDVGTAPGAALAKAPASMNDLLGTPGVAAAVPTETPPKVATVRRAPLLELARPEPGGAAPRSEEAPPGAPSVAGNDPRASKPQGARAEGAEESWPLLRLLPGALEAGGRATRPPASALAIALPSVRAEPTPNATAAPQSRPLAQTAFAPPEAGANKILSERPRPARAFASEADRRTLDSLSSSASAARR